MNCNKMQKAKTKHLFSNNRSLRNFACLLQLDLLALIVDSLFIDWLYNSSNMI